jgi:hypothetical protein
MREQLFEQTRYLTEVQFSDRCDRRSQRSPEKKWVTQEIKSSQFEQIAKLRLTPFYLLRNITD